MQDAYNIKLVVSYDGKEYLGWQKTRMGPSIEANLQKVIEQIMQHPCPLQAASRTDAGVHAKGQVVNFLTGKPDLDLHTFRISLNSLLPKNIVVLQAEKMPLNFHPTLDATGKEYRYYICYGPTQLPHHRFYSWHVHYSLDLTLMRQTIPVLIGTHPFEAFCNMKKNARYHHYLREIRKFTINRIDETRLCFEIQGNHFLYKMMRNLVGTMIDIGKGKINPDTLSEIIASKTRANAGVTAPAHGLFLHEVFY